MMKPSWLGGRARSLGLVLALVVCFGLAAYATALLGQEAKPPAQADAVARAAAALYEGIRVETLPNGLRVYLKPIPGAPTVTTMVAYKVGSADENLDHTGLSHYLEHLMFKGTDKIMPGDIDRLTLRNGGANNAYTSEDYTIYHFDFAADRWEPALEVEADRMRHLRIDAKHEFEGEKEVVVAELERNEDEPWDLEQKAILPLLFGKSGPYGHPVIGERVHVRGASAGVIKSHYDLWYYPNNAALVICGGFDPDRAMETIRKLFGPIPAKELPPRKTAAAIERPAPVHLQMPSKFDVPRMLMGFNTVRTGEPDYYPLEVLQAVLGTGKTCRLYRKLVEGAEIASSIGSSDSTGRYPGWFNVQVQLLKGKDPNKVEDLVLAEFKRLRDEPISAEELTRVQRTMLVGAIFQRASVHNLADSIARGVTTNDLDYLKTFLPRIAAVTAKEVQEAARKYLDPQKRVVVWSIPGNRQGDKETRRQGDKEIRRLGERVAKGDGAAGRFSLKETRRVVLDNGLTLLLLENHRLPIVVAEAHVNHTRLLEPESNSGVAQLVGRLLDEGTDKHKGPAIAELIENVGGTLDMNANGGRVHVLSTDRGLGLQLLFECLARANFPEEAFTRERRSQLSEIDDLETQPDSRAARAFRELAYGKHPLGRPGLGKRPTVEKLTRQDCVDFHRKLFVPNNTVVAVVGDFDAKQLVDEVMRMTANWKKAELPAIDVPPVTKPDHVTQRVVTMPESAQLHFYMGHAGIKRTNPDYYKLLVMDYVLGTGPGFTDRLSARLRDREGLAYTVSANISGSATDQPGLFICYIGTAPENFSKVKQMFLEELARIRAEHPQPAEVEDVKKYLLGNLPFRFATNDQVAAQLLAIERYHLGFNYVHDYQKAVTGVTPADVEAVARKYLDPDRLVLVAAGRIDQQGRPLAQLPPPKGPRK